MGLADRVTEPAGPRAEPPAGAHRQPPAAGTAARVLAALPLLLPAGVAAFGVVCMAALVAGRFSLPVLLPVGAVAVLLAWRAVGLRERVGGPEQRVCDLLALLLALAFAVVNARYADQNVVVGRDPGAYADAARWLVGHDSLVIDAHPDQFGGAVPYASAGFGYDRVPGHLFAQGSHLLPALLAVAGRLLGDTVLFAANSLVGGLALLAVYGFARLLVRPALALGAAALVGATLPMLAFSRDTFTEPVSQLLVFGGLALLWRARQQGGLGLHLVAGLTLGASVLARPDSLLVVPALAGALLLALALAPAGERRRTAGEVGAVAVAVAGPVVLGLLDLQRLSSGYYTDRRTELSQIAVLAVAAVLGGALLVALAWGSSGRLPRLDAATRRWRPAAAAGGVLLLGAVLASRPLWLTARQADAGPAKAYVGGLQRLAKQAVDPNRTYAEHSLTWISWYLGPVATVLGLLGLALLAGRCTRDRRVLVLPFLLVFATTGLLYLVKPSIVPDQVWAMRRYLPVVLPGLAVAAAVAVQALLAPLARGGRRTLTGVLAAVLLVAVAVPVLRTTYPLARVREGSPQLAEVHRVCDALPDDAGVAVLGSFSNNYPQTVRSFCDVPAVALVKPAPGQLAAVAAALARAGRQLWVVVPQGDLALAPGVPGARPVITVTVRTWDASLVHPPTTAATGRRSLYVGRVGADGRVAQWAAGR